MPNLNGAGLDRSAVPAASPNLNPNPNNPSVTDSVQYRIGDHSLSAPFVTVDQLKGHLALLHAFLQLRKTVDSIPDNVIHDEYDEVLPFIPHKRWSCFLHLCVERFMKWSSALNQNDAEGFIENALPPIDILMVWHAYMLNPGWYLEDCLRLVECQNLKLVGTVLGEVLVDIPLLLAFPISESRRRWWSTRIPDMDFDIFNWMKTRPSKVLQCPSSYCELTFKHPYLNKDTGEGYLQSSFATRCPVCGTFINKESLAMRKFARAFASYESADDLRQYFAGTVLTPENVIDLEKARLFKRIVQKKVLSKTTIDPEANRNEEHKMCAFASTHGDPVSAVKWDVASAVTEMSTSKDKESFERLMQRVFTAYVNDHPFSLDLASAVYRQFQFSDKMEKVGWTHPSAFTTYEEEKVLVHAITRYHAFMDLMTTAPGNFLVPTLDIDLGWHTHQLLGAKYESDCRSYTGRFIDHDDSVDQLKLGQGFERTCKAWESRFGLRYAYCGCGVPPASIIQRVSRAFSTKIRRHQSKNKLLHKDNMEKSQPLPEEKSFAKLTHPSYTGLDLDSQQERISLPYPSKSSVTRKKALAKQGASAQSKIRQEHSSLEGVARKTGSSSYSDRVESGMTMRQMQAAASIKQRREGHTPLHRLAAASVLVSSGCGSYGDPVECRRNARSYTDWWWDGRWRKARFKCGQRVAARSTSSFGSQSGGSYSYSGGSAGGGSGGGGSGGGGSD